MIHAYCAYVGKEWNYGIWSMNLLPEFEWLVQQYCREEQYCCQDNNIVQKNSAKIGSISR